MSVSIELDTSDFDTKMIGIITDLPLIPDSFLDQGSALVEEIMRDTVPVKTGTLKASIQRQVLPDSAVIETTSGYGLFVDQDTQSHVIEPIFANFLKFEIDGITVFARRVHHPGTKGQNFVARTLQAVRDQLSELLSKIVGDVLEGKEAAR